MEIFDKKLDRYLDSKDLPHKLQILPPSVFIIFVPFFQNITLKYFLDFQLCLEDPNSLHCVKFGE